MTKSRFARLLRREQAAQRETAAILATLRQMTRPKVDEAVAIAREHSISVEDARSFIKDMEN